MKTLHYLVLVMLFACVSNVYAMSFLDSLDTNAVQKEQWAKRPAWIEESAKTQGGGWYWYPGQSIGRNNLNDSEREAYIKALFMAVQDCKDIPKDAAINERFSEILGGKHYVYVRVAIKASSCISMRECAKSGTCEGKRNSVFKRAIIDHLLAVTKANISMPDEFTKENSYGTKRYKFSDPWETWMEVYVILQAACEQTESDGACKFLQTVHNQFYRKTFE
jgi:hypothetical protein